MSKKTPPLRTPKRACGRLEPRAQIQLMAAAVRPVYELHCQAQQCTSLIASAITGPHAGQIAYQRGWRAGLVCGLPVVLCPDHARER